MSLQIWLSLNGDLKNNGLLGNTVITNHGATIDNNGKIGKCYAFDNNTSYISIQHNQLYKILNGSSQPMSICFWVFHADTTRAIIFGDYAVTGGNNFNIELATNHTLRWYWSSPDIGISAMNVGLNTWTHVAFTYNGAILKGYINGVEKYSNTVVLNAKNRSSGEYYIGRDNRTGTTTLNGKLNDFRIYDHCLSDKEVDEISKGLVLHYQLNNNGLGGNNLLTGTNDFSEWYLNSRWSKNGKIATYSAGSKAWNDMDSPTISWSEVQGKTLTISAELRSDDFNYTDGSGFSICFVRKASGPAATGYSTRRLECTPIHLTKNQITTKWKKYSSTILNISDSSFTNTYNGGGGDWFGIYIWNYTNKSVQIKNIKLEIGNIATNYSPAPIDIGMNSNIIYDSSGYNNNGEIINTLSTEIPSPKNNISLHFSATNQKIKISGLSTTGFSNSYSFAWWEKINSVAPMHWGFSDGVRLNGMYTGRLWNTGDGSNNPLYNPGTTTQVAAPSVNIWHHWVMTGDGTKCLVYQDGVLWAEAKTYKTITGTTIYINGWDTSTSYCSDNASISDFRLYSTALTAEQIKELYKTSKIADGTTVKARDLEVSA